MAIGNEPAGDRMKANREARTVEKKRGSVIGLPVHLSWAASNRPAAGLGVGNGTPLVGLEKYFK